MCFGKPAGRAPVKPTPPAESEAPSERPEPAHASGRRHYWRRRPKLDPTKPPTEGQIAFYCYLLFRRDQKIAPRHFAEEGMVGKIEELKKNLPVDQGKCTWPQWRKLFGLLAEKAELKARCQVLNGLSSVSQASSAIDEWLKKSEAMEPEEAAA
jgi:hypothetical protein